MLIMISNRIFDHSENHEAKIKVTIFNKANKDQLICCEILEHGQYLYFPFEVAFF